MSHDQSASEDSLNAGSDHPSQDADSILREAARISGLRSAESEPGRCGERLGPFVLGAELGRGAMGVVYEAEDLRLRRRVALKMLPREAALDPERRARFVREARAASAVIHRNVATILEAGEVDGNTYIAMELVGGRTLRAMLCSGKPLPVKETLEVAKQLALGLKSAHAARIVHRDLKPENVMVNADGVVKVLDFGLAKRWRAEETAPLHEAETASGIATVEGRVLGTPHYMSPEQAKGRPVDARSDVFSFGVLLYELLTGVRPFRGSTVEVLIGIDRDEPEPPSKLNRQVGRALERLTLRCLDKVPERRFHDGGELLMALDTIESDDRRAARVRVLMLALTFVITATAGAFAWAAIPNGPPLAASGQPTPSEPQHARDTQLPVQPVASVPTAPAVVAQAPMPSPTASQRLKPRSRPTSPPSASALSARPALDPLAHQK